MDPVDCPVASVLEFHQDRFSAGLSPSTLNVYVAWDLAVILEGLSLALFEPHESASEKFISLKVAFLLAIMSP